MENESLLQFYMHHAITDLPILGLLEILKAIVIGIVVYAVIRFRDYRKLHSNRDDSHISASLNYVDSNNNFVLRTVGEGGIGINDLFENVELRAIFTKARKHTSPDNIFLKFPPSVATEISSILMGYITAGSSHGFFREAAGLNVKKTTYVFMATREYYGLMRVQKTRIIITPLEMLDNLPEEQKLIFERERHRDRMQTLREKKKRFDEMSSEERIDHRFELAFEI